MKIQVEVLGMPTLSGSMGKKTQVELTQGTVRDVIEILSKKHGPQVRGALLDSEGNLDMTIQVVINNHYLPREEMACRPLAEGDKVTFLLLVGGG